MKLYVINLERAQTRLERMQRLFAARHLSFTRIRAIDGAQLDDKTYKEINAVNLWPQPLTHGEIACFLSHKKALEKLIADEVPYGVIFEDDAVLGAGAEKILGSSNWLPAAGAAGAAGIDVVKLETSGKKVWLGCPQPVMLAGSVLMPFSLAPIKSSHIMAAAYLVSRAAAMRLVDLMSKASAPFDHFLFNFSLGIAPQLRLSQLDPAIAIQANLGSQLEGERAIIKRRQRGERRFGHIVGREVTRVFHRAGIGLWGLTVNYCSDEQWKRVAFNSADGSGEK